MIALFFRMYIPLCAHSVTKSPRYNPHSSHPASYFCTETKRSKVRAYKLVGTMKVFGPYSAAAAGVPLAKAALSSAVATGKDRVKLTWAKVPGAGGYQIYVSGAASGTYKPLKTTTATSFTVTGLKPNTAYYFKVAAYKRFSTTNYFGPISAYRGVKTLK